MNGGSLNFPTRYPLTTPISKQLTSAIRIASTGFIPPVIRVAEIMALIPTMDPIARSMFPVSST